MQISNMNDFKYGHFLKQIIDIWSNRDGGTRGFHALDNSCNFLLRWRRKIKRNATITFMRFISFNGSLKQVVPWTALKDGNRGAGFENVFGTAARVFTYFIIVVGSNGSNNNWIIIITIKIMIIIKVLFKNIWPPHPWKLSAGIVIPRGSLALLAYFQK